MQTIKSNRIESIDILRGVVMILMALDHVRDYFHLNAFFSSNPEDIDTTTPILFFTRFITHFCAPIFIFLAGTSAFLYGQKRTKKQLSTFLISRGFWLIFVEIAIMNFLWWFDTSYSFINLQVIWAIGWCMVVLGILIHLPRTLLLFIGLLIVLGHNSLDGFTMQSGEPFAWLWHALHQFNGLQLSDNHFVSFSYPVLPWIGVIVLGYCFGALYQQKISEQKRKKWLLNLGLVSLALFFLIRGINSYGDMYVWEMQETVTKNVLSFFKVTKYPPSLHYLLITLGPGFLFLYGIENYKNKLTHFLLTFGRVPFFYYLLHVFAIHLLALLVLVVSGKDWTVMIITKDALWQGKLAGYGYSLWVVYLVWIAIVIGLYPICRKFMRYKANHKDKWWLSYL